MSQRILVVSQDDVLRETRAAILRSTGYTVESVSSDDEAVALLALERFDLVVLERNSHLLPVALDQRLRSDHPDIAILKIAGENGTEIFLPVTLVRNRGKCFRRSGKCFSNRRPTDQAGSVH